MLLPDLVPAPRVLLPQPLRDPPHEPGTSLPRNLRRDNTFPATFVPDMRFLAAEFALFLPSRTAVRSARY
eukprot:959355-Rhodomonas_salina.4